MKTPKKGNLLMKNLLSPKATGLHTEKSVIKLREKFPE